MSECIACGGRDFLPLKRSGEWTIEACRQCGQGVLSPFPGPERLASFYDGNYFRERYREPLMPGSQALAKRVRQESHRIKQLKKHLRQGRLLDVGCGSGYFLYAAQNAGFDALGCDIADVNREYVEKQLNCRMETGSLSELPFTNSSFDAITLWHTLEHHVDPAASLGQCLRWLRPGGILLVEVPNYDSIDARRYEDQWPNWDVPFHLHHFTKKSLLVFLQRFDLQILGVKTYHSEYVKERLIKTVVFRPLARIIARLCDGSSVLVRCRRD